MAYRVFGRSRRGWAPGSVRETAQLPALFRSRWFRYAVSWGHHRSLIVWLDRRERMATSFRLAGAQLESYKAYAGDGIFRMSVGLEDGEDLCADLDRVLA